MRETFDTVLVAEPAGRAAMEEAIALAGGRVVDRLGWDELPTLEARQGLTPVLAVRADGVPDALVEAGLPWIARVATRLAPEIVVTLDRRQIDPVASALLAPTVQLLCDEGMARLVAALAVAGLAAPAGLHDRVGEGGDDALRRLKDEIGRIAELLIRLADRNETLPPDDEGGVADRRISFGFEPPAAGSRCAACGGAGRSRLLETLPALDLYYAVHGGGGAAGAEGCACSCGAASEVSSDESPLGSPMSILSPGKAPNLSCSHPIRWYGTFSVPCEAAVR